MTPAHAANAAVVVFLVAAAVRLIVWALSGEPGRVHHGDTERQQ
ncbi:MULTISPECIES: hypothetical protein [unclassified Streptomyces]|nr:MULTISPECIES: hypothetical protein [unclassified Streptomyces]